MNVALRVAALAMLCFWAAPGARGGVQSSLAPQYRSRICIYDLGRKSVRVVYETDGVFEAPNWSPDASYLLVNAKGRLLRLPLGRSGPVQPIELALPAGYTCNNDKGLSPDGKQLAFSASTPSTRGSQIFLAGADGSAPRLVVAPSPSYFHGWSPDGRWLAYVARRDRSFALYRVSAFGESAPSARSSDVQVAEERLTFNGAYDDGPDYSPDGKWIYFNSNRAGGWDVWRIPSDGAGPNDSRAEQITRDEPEDWFPHVSPDGRWIVFLSFPRGTPGHDGRMEGVTLRLMRAPADKSRDEPGEQPGAPAIQALTTLYGGQGTINVNSWAPDSGSFAFVAYEPISAGSKPY